MGMQTLNGSIRGLTLEGQPIILMGSWMTRGCCIRTMVLLMIRLFNASQTYLRLL